MRSSPILPSQGSPADALIETCSPSEVGPERLKACESPSALQATEPF